MPAAYPTGHPDVDALLGALLSGIQAALGSDLVGLYLHGSLALGDFDPARSDIDFVAVTRGELAQESESALAAMHARIAASDLRWTANYEGSYIPQGAIRRYDFACCVHPAIRVDGRFGPEHHGADWVILGQILREHGVVLTGPPPASTRPTPCSPCAACFIRCKPEPLQRSRRRPGGRKRPSGLIGAV